jgi:hypothetical protein
MFAHLLIMPMKSLSKNAPLAQQCIFCFQDSKLARRHHHFPKITSDPENKDGVNTTDTWRNGGLSLKTTIAQCSQ